MGYESTDYLINSHNYMLVKNSFKYNVDYIESGVNNYSADNVRKFKEFVKKLFSKSFKKVSYVCDKIHKAVIVSTTKGVLKFEVSSESALIEPKSEIHFFWIESLLKENNISFESLCEGKFLRFETKNL